MAPPMKEASPCPSTALAVAQVDGDTCVFRPCHIPGVYTLLELLGAGAVSAEGTLALLTPQHITGSRWASTIKWLIALLA